MQGVRSDRDSLSDDIDQREVKMLDAVRKVNVHFIVFESDRFPQAFYVYFLDINAIFDVI